MLSHTSQLLARREPAEFDASRPLGAGSLFQPASIAVDDSPPRFLPAGTKKYDGSINQPHSATMEDELPVLVGLRFVD